MKKIVIILLCGVLSVSISACDYSDTPAVTSGIQLPGSVTKELLYDEDGSLNMAYLKELMSKSADFADNIPNDVYDALIDTFIGLDIKEKEEFLECSYVGTFPPDMVSGTSFGRGCTEYNVSEMYAKLCHRFQERIKTEDFNVDSEGVQELLSVYTLMDAVRVNGKKLVVFSNADSENENYYPLDIELALSLFEDKYLDFLISYNGYSLKNEDSDKLNENCLLVEVLSNRTGEGLYSVFTELARDKESDLKIAIADRTMDTITDAMEFSKAMRTLEIIANVSVTNEPEGECFLHVLNLDESRMIASMIEHADEECRPYAIKDLNTDKIEEYIIEGKLTSKELSVVEENVGIRIDDIREGVKTGSLSEIEGLSEFYERVHP